MTMMLPRPKLAVAPMIVLHCLPIAQSVSALTYQQRQDNRPTTSNGEVPTLLSLTKPRTTLNRLLNSNEDEEFVSVFVDSKGNEYDPYSLAWRYLGIYMDCDIDDYGVKGFYQDDDGQSSAYAYDDDGYDDDVDQEEMLDWNRRRMQSEERRLSGSKDGDSCTRKVMWAAYHDKGYRGGQIGEYQFYNFSTGEYSKEFCTNTNIFRGRCVRMDCHEPNTHMKLVGVFKESDGLVDWAEQLFKHQGYCLWGEDDYEFMENYREFWPTYCRKLYYSGKNGETLYMDLQPTGEGNITVGIYTDDKCVVTSEYYTFGDYIMMYYNYYGYYEKGAEVVATWEYAIKQWNQYMKTYKICQPCRAYSLNIDLDGDSHSGSGSGSDDRDRNRQRLLGEENDGEGEEEKNGYNCYDDAGYTNCNQCYKFETKTDFEEASEDDLIQANKQGTILEIRYQGQLYGRGGYRGPSKAPVKGILSVALYVVTALSFILSVVYILRVTPLLDIVINFLRNQVTWLASFFHWIQSKLANWGRNRHELERSHYHIEDEKQREKGQYKPPAANRGVLPQFSQGTMSSDSVSAPENKKNTIIELRTVSSWEAHSESDGDFYANSEASVFQDEPIVQENSSIDCRANDPDCYEVDLFQYNNTVTPPSSTPGNNNAMQGKDAVTCEAPYHDIKIHLERSNQNDDVSLQLDMTNFIIDASGYEVNSFPKNSSSSPAFRGSSRCDNDSTSESGSEDVSCETTNDDIASSNEGSNQIEDVSLQQANFITEAKYLFQNHPTSSTGGGTVGYNNHAYSSDSTREATSNKKLNHERGITNLTIDEVHYEVTLYQNHSSSSSTGCNGAGCDDAISGRETAACDVLYDDNNRTNDELSHTGDASLQQNMSSLINDAAGYEVTLSQNHFASNSTSSDGSKTVAFEAPYDDIAGSNERSNQNEDVSLQWDMTNFNIGAGGCEVNFFQSHSTNSSISGVIGDGNGATLIHEALAGPCGDTAVSSNWLNQKAEFSLQGDDSNFIIGAVGYEVDLFQNHSACSSTSEVTAANNGATPISEAPAGVIPYDENAVGKNGLNQKTNISLQAEMANFINDVVDDEVNLFQYDHSASSMTGCVDSCDNVVMLHVAGGAPAFEDRHDGTEPNGPDFDGTSVTTNILRGNFAHDSRTRTCETAVNDSDSRTVSNNPKASSTGFSCHGIIGTDVTDGIGVIGNPSGGHRDGRNPNISHLDTICASNSPRDGEASSDGTVPYNGAPLGPDATDKKCRDGHSNGNRQNNHRLDVLNGSNSTDAGVCGGGRDIPDERDPIVIVTIYNDAQSNTEEDSRKISRCNSTISASADVSSASDTGNGNVEVIAHRGGYCNATNDVSRAAYGDSNRMTDEDNASNGPTTDVTARDPNNCDDGHAEAKGPETGDLDGNSDDLSFVSACGSDVYREDNS